MKEKVEETRVFSAWARTGDAVKEKILFKEGLQALKVINASQYTSILSQKNFFSLLQSDSGFRAKFAAFMTEQVRILVHHVSPCFPVLPTPPRWRQAFLQSAFFFEMPGVTASSSVKRPFEFALVGAGDGIDRREDDPVTFRRHFDRSL